MGWESSKKDQINIMYDFGLVSIIMPSYNSEKYIEASIKSILSQSYANWELLIVDDCSKDKTVEIIKTFCDERIKIFINEHNNGAALSRNKALREAKGKWIAFLDSDDIWLPTKLEEQVKFMYDNNYFFTYTDYRICNNGKWERIVRTTPNKVTYRKLFNYCYFSTITVVYSTEKIGLIQIGDLKKNNDYAMWFKALKKTTAYRYPKCLSYYIKHNNSVSSGRKTSLIKHHYILFKNEMGYGKIKSTLLTINNLWHGFWKKLIYRRKIKEGCINNG